MDQYLADCFQPCTDSVFQTPFGAQSRILFNFSILACAKYNLWMLPAFDVETTDRGRLDGRGEGKLEVMTSAGCIGPWSQPAEVLWNL